MVHPDTAHSVSFRDGASRRDFLQAGALAPIGLTLPAFLQAKTAGPSDRDVNCILLMLVGGPSQLDTFDPKPDAPAEVRGPFKSASTKVAGIRITDIFPETARHTDKFSIIRSLYHTATAVHDTGHQLMQTGRLFTGGVEHPHMGCVLGYLKGGRERLPAHVMLPRQIGRTGGNLPHGESAGYLGKRFDPLILNADGVECNVADTLMSSPKACDAFDLRKEPAKVRDRYGRTRFGQSCLMARRLVEAGVRFVTVNMFETVFDEPTWDTHGSKPFTDIAEMTALVVPSFDRAYSALLEDLSARGLLSNTIVAATGEFGRTPKINPVGGRDHHPGVWSMLIGGGPIQGGRVVGESDALGYAPKSRPTTPAEVAATIYQGLGLDPHAELPGPQNRPLPLVDIDTKPIAELF